MELDKLKFTKEILKKRFNNNQRQCALALNVSPAFINKIVKTEADVGPKFLGQFKVYCIENDLEFDDYIFLP